MMNGGVTKCYDTVADPDDHPNSLVPVEKIPSTTKVLWLVGLGEDFFPSEKHAEKALEKRKCLPESERNNLQVKQFV